MRGVAYSKSEIDRALALVATGVSDYEVSRRTGIPRSTILNWRRGRLPRASAASEALCSRCGERGHNRLDPPAPEYAYLLGQYLGDGTVFRNGQRSYGLRIATDASYPGIIQECCRAIERIKDRRPYVRRDPSKRFVTITSYWRVWPCLLPQHGPGRKHHRTIALLPWQVDIVEAYPGRFLRGLIHSDGWRGVNRVRVKGRDYAYPRYQFSNRSADIRQLFVYGCELIGVSWTRWGRYHISVARRDAVELLDQFVGPKT